MFQAVLTGKEIKLRNPHQDILSDDLIYLYKENGFSKNGIINSEATLMPTEDESLQLQKQQRILELESLIEKKKLRGYDYSAELQELEELDTIL